MAATIDDTIDTFVRIVNKSHPDLAAAQADADQLVQKVFCLDGGANPDFVPRVGITEHGNNLGPRFVDAAQVSYLFYRLFCSFPDIHIGEFGPRTYSRSSPTTVGIQTTLTGTFTRNWFQHGEHPPPPPAGEIQPGDFFSYPLSAIHHFGTKIEIPAAAFFTFSGTEVTVLAMYFDRYRFTQLSGLPQHEINREISHLLSRHK